MDRAGTETAAGSGLMGILKDVWWLLGILMAAPLVLPGVENLLSGSYPWAVLFISLGAVVLFLPEYLRWRLLGGSSVLERVPLIGTRATKEAE